MSVNVYVSFLDDLHDLCITLAIRTSYVDLHSVAAIYVSKWTIRVRTGWDTVQSSALRC
jgi:hypothetical protein